MSIRGPRTNMVIASRFKTVRCLARGGFGTVYLAHDEFTDERCALKLVNIRGKAKIEAETLREIAIMKKLENVDYQTQLIKGGKSYDSSRNPIIYLAMELAIGSLDSFLKKNEERGTVPSVCEKSVLSAGYYILAGLKQLHKRGIIHRDIKSANVFIFPKAPGKLKIGDFGLACEVVQNGRRVKPASSVAPFRALSYGSPHYADPLHEHCEIDDGWMLGLDLIRLHGCKVMEGRHEDRLRFKQQMLQDPASVLPHSVRFLLPYFEKLVQQPLQQPIDIDSLQRALQADRRRFRKVPSLTLKMSTKPPTLV